MRPPWPCWSPATCCSSAASPALARSCDGCPESTRGLIATVLREGLPLLVVTVAGLALVATIGLARYVRAGGWGALVVYGGAMLLALYTHYYALLLLTAQDVCVAWLAWRGELPRGAGRRWVVAQAALALGFLPWLPA